MEREVKLLIVDDHPVFRRGLREIIEENPRFHIIGDAADGETALRLTTELKPDVVIVDIDMPRLNGLEVMRTLQRTKSPAIVMVLTM